MNNKTIDQVVTFKCLGYNMNLNHFNMKVA
jgi:hypothetical protein